MRCVVSKTREELVNNPNEPSILDYTTDTDNQGRITNSLFSLDLIIAEGGTDFERRFYSPAATHMMKLFSQTSKTMQSILKQELDERDAEQLLIYVLQVNEANKVKILEIAKTNPRLFFIKATAQDCAMDLEGNRRTIKDWSPYQALFGTSDKYLLAEVKPYLDTYLKTLPNGDELATEQEQEKFPNGFDFPPCTDEFNRLVEELAAAVTNDQQLKQNLKNPSPETLALLVKFRKYLQPGIVETGHHYNMNDVIKTHEIFKQFEYNNQLAFWSMFIIGFQQRLMTAPYLQAACTGLDKHVTQNQPLRRDFKLAVVTHDGDMKEITVVPFSGENPSCRLGEGFAINGYYGCGEAGWYAWRLGEVRAGVPLYLYLENFVKQTQQSFQGLCISKEAGGVMCNCLK